MSGRQHGALLADDIESPRIGFAADPLQLLTELLEADLVLRCRERMADVGIERQHHRQMVLTIDLRPDGACDELDAWLVDRLKRSQPVLAPQMGRGQRRGADDGERSNYKKR